MKKLNIVLLIVVIGFSFSTIAQVTFGPKVGVNLAKYSFNFKDASDEPDIKSRLAPLIGIAVNSQFNEALALQTGIFYSGKGCSFDLDKMSDGDVDVDGYWRISSGYLELPVNLAYGFPMGESQLQIFAGPYVAYGITGKMKMDFTVKSGGDSESVNEEIKIKFKGTVDENDEEEEDVTYQSALDFGLNFGVGFKTGPILINAGYGMGFSNIEPKWSGAGEDDRDDWKYTNSVINFSISYFFGG
jgi:hypothetical protein